MKISYMIKIILNGTGTETVAKMVPETITISKIRSGVYHYHFQNFSDRGSLYYRITAKYEVIQNNRTGDFIPHY